MVGGPRAHLLSDRRPEQEERMSAFGTGDLSSWDSSLPFSVNHTEAFDLRLLVVPRTCSALDQNLGDPGLGPESLARAHYISTRWVHNLFAKD
jgi:hypothetical protein